MKKEKYLCHQIVVNNQEQSGSTTNISVNIIIRIISAKSEEEAIGKFIVQTRDIEAFKKLNPICCKLDTVLTID